MKKLNILLITGIVTDEHDPKMNPMIRLLKHPMSAGAGIQRRHFITMSAMAAGRLYTIQLLLKESRRFRKIM